MSVFCPLMHLRVGAALCPAMSLPLARFALAPTAPADAAALGRLAVHGRSAGWDEGAFEREIARSAARVWLGKRAEVIVGAVVASEAAGQIELLWLAVHPAARRQGLARQLVGAVLGWAAERDAEVQLEVRASNAAALALYHGEGFVVVGRRPRYYADGEDAVLLDHLRPREILS